MKKIIFTVCVILSLFFFTTELNAVSVEVTEPIPGANCSGWGGEYTCNVGTGVSTISNMMGEIIKYFTFIASLWAVLFIVINGILYSMSGMDQSLKDGAKKRIIQTLLGLTLLMLSWVILNAVAPWIYK